MTNENMRAEFHRLEFTCVLCGAKTLGAEAAHLHLSSVHGQPDAERWPDGEIVIYDETIETTPE